MPKRAAGLSARAVETAKEPGLFADGNGLYLQVTNKSAKSWIFRYVFAGKRRDMGLGPVSVFGLADAREKALDARRKVLNGIDPLEEKKAKVALRALEVARGMTFREAAKSYITAMKAGWANKKHAAQWTSTLETYAYPTLSDLSVAVVDTGLVLKVVEPIWMEKPETASRVRGRIEAILDYAKVRGWRDGDNPARWRGHLSLILPAKSAVAKVEHHASLPYAKIPDFWKQLQKQAGTGPRALQFAILTATRTQEVMGARWSEIDVERGIWSIPSERMKAKALHRVPLTDVALALLKKMKADSASDYVFPGQQPDKPLSNMAMAMTLRRMKMDVTAHGFRSTFRTWAAEKTSFPREVAEAALAHTQGDKVVEAYQRGDLFEKRSELMIAWADYVAGKAKISADERRLSSDD